LMSRPLNRRTNLRGTTAPQGNCCLFCGALASDKRLIGRLNGHVCEDCVREAGRLFSKQRFTPVFMISERCISCGRTARSQVLVSGVAAAICRRCYNSVKGNKKTVTIPGRASLFPPKERLRDLKQSRAAWLRARRRYEHFSRAMKSRPASDQPNLLVEQAFAGRDMMSPLSLVTSRERVLGRPALKYGDGQVAPWRLRVWIDPRIRRKRSV